MSSIDKTKKFTVSWEDWEKAQEYELTGWEDDRWIVREHGILNTKYLSGFINLEWEQDNIVGFEGKTILEVGGGPHGLMLYCKDLKKGYNIEPLALQDPEREQRVIRQYADNNITVIRQPAELVDLEFLGLEEKLDEVWTLGVLQHVLDPYIIIRNMAKIAKRVRIVDWGYLPPHEGHPWMLTTEMFGNTLSPLGKEVLLQRQDIHITPPESDSTLCGTLVVAIYDID